MMLQSFMTGDLVGKFVFAPTSTLIGLGRTLANYLFHTKIMRICQGTVCA